MCLFVVDLAGDYAVYQVKGETIVLTRLDMDPEFLFFWVHIERISILREHVKKYIFFVHL